MRRDLSGHRRSLWMANALVLIGVFAAITLTGLPDLQAQKPQAQKARSPRRWSSPRAPFTVVDNDNMPILRVQTRVVWITRSARVQ